jgi:hypothetical protein
MRTGENCQNTIPQTKQAKPNRQRLEEPLKPHQNHERAGNRPNSIREAGKYVKS